MPSAKQPLAMLYSGSGSVNPAAPPRSQGGGGGGGVETWRQKPCFFKATQGCPYCPPPPHPKKTAALQYTWASTVHQLVGSCCRLTANRSRLIEILNEPQQKRNISFLSTALRAPVTTARHLQIRCALRCDAVVAEIQERHMAVYEKIGSDEAHGSVVDDLGTARFLGVVQVAQRGVVGRQPIESRL